MIASVTYNTSGSAGPYTVPFPYLEQADVDVYLDGVANTAFTFTSATAITLNSAPSATAIEIRRATNNTPYVDFTPPAPLIPEDLDTAYLQALYIAQEAKDYIDRAVIAEGAVPSVAGGDVGQFLKATAVNTYSFESILATDVAGVVTNTIIDAKGDLIAGTAADTPAKVAVGANRTILEADSAATPGIAWVARSLGLKSMQVFNSSGTWTRPTGIRKVLVMVVGGGGGGGGLVGAAASHATSSGAGGGGGTAIALLDVSAIGTSTITVGGGGAGGAAGANAGAVGTNSTWVDGTNTITGNGGTGGSAGNENGTAPGGNGGGGTAAGGYGIQGDAGASGFYNSGGVTANSPSGGGSHLGGGAAGPGANAAGANANANTGGGGSGALSHGDSNNRAGGNGGSGRIIVYEYE